MTRWSRFLSIASLCIGLFATAQCHAGECAVFEPCDPCYYDLNSQCSLGLGPGCCCDPCCFPPFSIGADFICWHPSVSDLDYAAEVHVGTISSVSSVPKIDMRYKHIELNWEPGLRIRFGVPRLWSGISFMGSYVYLRANDNSKKNSAVTKFLVSPLQHGGANVRFTEIKGRYTFVYQSWDALLALPKQICEDSLWIPFAGLQGFQLAQNLKTELYNPSTVNGGFIGETRWKSDLIGVGLTVGQDYEIRFCRCFKFFTRVAGSITAGDPITESDLVISNSAETTGIAVDIEDDFCCIFMPGYHVQLGVSYTCTYGNIEYSVRVGYDFLKWFNLPTERRFPNDSRKDIALASYIEPRTLGFNGILLGFEVLF